MKPGTWSYGAGFGFQAPDILESENSRPVIEGFGRYGVIKGMDLGLKHSPMGTTSIDMKQALYGSGTLSLSTGFGVAYAGYRNPDSAEEIGQSFNSTEIHVPVYSGWEPKSWMVVYMTPRFVQRFLRYETNGEAKNQQTPIFGYSLGMIFGTSWGIGLEYSNYRSFGANQDRGGVRQLMAAFIIGLENVD